MLILRQLLAIFCLTLALLIKTKTIERKIVFKPVTQEFVKNIVNDVFRNKAGGRDIPLNFLEESTFTLPYLRNASTEF